MGTAMRAKKLVILLAVLLVVGLGLFGWFRPREVVLPENCRLRITTDSFSDDHIFVDDPEKKSQLLELLSALRVRRYFKQPESDFPPGLTLRVDNLLKHKEILRRPRNAGLGNNGPFQNDPRLYKIIAGGLLDLVEPAYRFHNGLSLRV